jgi:hypothetical protein
MYKELENDSDQSLLIKYTANPTSEEGQAADAILRYRQYVATKASNKWLVILTIVLAISGLLQSGAAWGAILLVTKQKSNQIDPNPIPHESAEETSKIKDIQEQVHRIEEHLDKLEANNPPNITPSPDISKHK